MQEWEYALFWIWLFSGVAWMVWEFRDEWQTFIVPAIVLGSPLLRIAGEEIVSWF